MPSRAPTRNSMIAEGFRLRLLPARTPTRNPLDFEGFRVEEMFQYWGFAHTQSTIECGSFAQTQSTLERGPSPDKINGKMEGPTNQTQTQKPLRLFNVGGLSGTRGFENRKPHCVWVCFCSFFVFPFILSRDGFHPLYYLYSSRQGGSERTDFSKGFGIAFRCSAHHPKPSKCRRVFEVAF